MQPFLLSDRVRKGAQMSAAELQAIAEQIEQLAPEEKWALLSLLIESLRRPSESMHRRLGDYYGVGKGRGLETAPAVDRFIEEERASWER
jgi:hypothetical protein